MLSKITLSLYILAILTLSGWIAYRHYEQKVWLRYAQLLCQDMVKCEAFLEKRNEWMMDDVDRLVFSRPLSMVKLISIKNRQVADLTKSTGQTLNVLIGISNEYTETNNGFAYTDLLRTEQKQQLLIQTMALFQDSLILILSPDTSLNKHIKDACTINPDLLHSEKAEQKALYLLGLKLRVLTLVNKIYNHLQKEAFVNASFSDRVLPGITLSKPCIQAGEPFDGYLEGVPYCSKEHSKLYFYLNKHELPIEEGLGKVMLPSNELSKSLSLYIKKQYPVSNDYETIEKRIQRETCKN